MVRRRGCRDGVGEFGAGLAQASGQVIIVGVVDPPVKASAVDCDCDIREQCGAPRLTASPDQLGRECVSDGGDFVRPRSCNSGLRAMTSRRCAACEATRAPSTAPTSASAVSNASKG